MILKLNHPAVILAALGAASGFLGTFALGFGLGEAPHPGVFMVLTGVWFGLVIGYGVWEWGGRSWVAAASALASTWVAWELAVNLAVQLDSNWLKATMLSEAAKMSVAGVSAGALGSFLTWAGTAWPVHSLRHPSIACGMTAIGALFGLLLPLTDNYDSPAVLLLPWQAAVAAVLGLSLALRHGSSATALPPCPLSPSG
jgi:hypothetical protein